MSLRNWITGVGCVAAVTALVKHFAPQPNNDSLLLGLSVLPTVATSSVVQPDAIGSRDVELERVDAKENEAAAKLLKKTIWATLSISLDGGLKVACKQAEPWWGGLGTSLCSSLVASVLKDLGVSNPDAATPDQLAAAIRTLRRDQVVITRALAELRRDLAESNASIGTLTAKMQEQQVSMQREIDRGREVTGVKEAEVNRLRDELSRARRGADQDTVITGSEPTWPGEDSVVRPIQLWASDSRKAFANSKEPEFPIKAFDGTIATAWQGRVPLEDPPVPVAPPKWAPDERIDLLAKGYRFPDGVPWIVADFVREELISHIVMTPGFVKSEGVFYDNHRAGEVVVLVPGSEGLVELIRCQVGPSTMELAIEGLNIRTQRLVLAFPTIFAGHKWNDLAISEVRIYGEVQQAAQPRCYRPRKRLLLN